MKKKCFFYDNNYNYLYYLNGGIDEENIGIPIPDIELCI